jgi:hypothetical protein
MYSLKKAEPVVSLPWGFRHNGFNYTDPEQWFPLIGAAAGWVDVGDPPAVDSSTHHPARWNSQTGQWEMPAKTVSERREEVRAEVTVLFNQYSNSSTVILNAAIQTDRDAQGDLVRLRDRLQARTDAGEVDPVQQIATKSGVYIEATLAIATTLVDGVTAYTEQLWARDAVLNQQLDLATTVADINAIQATINTGWPT